MGLNTGNYSRFMHNEELQYLYGLVQQGIPWIDADDNDHRMSVATQLRRLGQMIGCGAIGNGFKILPETASGTDFIVQGGDGTLDRAGRFILNGYVCLLRENASYMNPGLSMAGQSIFPRITKITYDAPSNTTVLEDSAANWDINEHLGKSVYPNVGSGFTAIVQSNTQNTMTLVGNATVGGGVLGSYYRIGLTNIPGRVDGVFLNVYLDEYDSQDDPNLEHQLAVPSEAQRRAKLVHTIYVKEGSEDFPDYVDVDGNQHYTYQLARLHRTGGNLTEGLIEDLREVPLTSLDCDANGTPRSGNNNLIANGSFEQGCLDPMTDGGLFFEQTWGFWTQSGGLIEREQGGPDGFPFLRLDTDSGKGQVYTNLGIHAATMEEFPITVSFDIRVFSTTSDPSYAGTSPEGLPYSGRVLVGDSVYYLYNSSSEPSMWRRVTVTFPEQVGSYSQLSFEAGPNASIGIARVSAVVGEVAKLAPMTSSPLVPKSLDTKVFYQDFLSQEWIIRHNLGTQVPLFHIWDQNNVSLHERYQTVDFVDEQTLVIRFDEPQIGKVVLTANVCSGSSFTVTDFPGSYVGATPNREAYAVPVLSDSSYQLVEFNHSVCVEDNRVIDILANPPEGFNATIYGGIDKIHIQSDPQDTWTITHGLKTTDLIVRVQDQDGSAIPGTLLVIDDNTIEVQNTTPTTGTVLIKAHKKPDMFNDRTSHPVLKRASCTITGGTNNVAPLVEPEEIAVYEDQMDISGQGLFEFIKGGTVYRFTATFNGTIDIVPGRVDSIITNVQGGTVSTLALDGVNVDQVSGMAFETHTGCLGKLPAAGTLFDCTLWVTGQKGLEVRITSKGDWEQQNIRIDAMIFANHKEY